jgi:hypothetical protein
MKGQDRNFALLLCFFISCADRVHRLALPLRCNYKRKIPSDR